MEKMSTIAEHVAAAHINADNRMFPMWDMLPDFELKIDKKRESGSVY